MIAVLRRVALACALYASCLAHGDEEAARALLADAERLTAANAVELAEEAVEDALDLEFEDPELRIDLLNQAAVLRIMRSDWLGAWALLNRAETLQEARSALPPDAQVNILRSLL